MRNWDWSLHEKTGIGLAFIARYMKLFVNRHLIFGAQKIGRDGRVRYRNNIPGTIDILRIRQALYGERTYAQYGNDKRGKSKWTMLDLDVPAYMRKDIEATSDPEMKDKLQKHAWGMIYLMANSLMAEIKNLGLTPVPLSSGSKGIHIYVLYDKLIDAEHAVKLGLLVKHLTQQSQESSDMAGIIDYMAVESYPCPADLNALKTNGIPHLVKLPLVKHLGSGNYSRFLDPDDLNIANTLPPLHLWDLKPDPHETILELLESYAEELKEAAAQQRIHTNTNDNTNNHTNHNYETYHRKNIPEGPKKVIERCSAMAGMVYKSIREHHLTHEERLFVLFNMLAFGGDGITAVHDLMRQASDYEFGKTQRFINHALRKNYSPFLCETAQARGICKLKEACDAVGMYRTPLGTITGYDADNRSKIQPVLDNLEPEYETGNLDEIRIELKDKLLEYLKEPSERALLIHVDPGVGKTFSTAQTLMDLPEDIFEGSKNIFWAAQRHELYPDIALHIPDLKWIYPKIGKDDDFPDSRPEKAGLCIVEENRSKLRQIRNKGWGEIEIEKICLKCSIGTKNCEYYKQWNYVESFFAPQQHLTTRRIQENKIKADVIVIDENPASVFDSEIIVTQAEIDEMIDLIQKGIFARKELMIKLLNTLRRTIATYRKLTQGYQVIKDWDERIRLLHGDNNRQTELIDNKTPEKGLHYLLNEIDKTRFWIDWEAFIEMAEPDELPKNWLQPLFRTVKQEKLLFDIEHNSRIYVKKQESNMVMGILESKTFKNQDIPLIFLDATADIATYKRIFNREIIHFSRQVKLENPVYQLIDGEYPNISIMPDNERCRSVRTKLLRFTKAIIEQGEKTLVVSTMPFHNKYLVKHLRNARLSKNYVTGYYRNLRGSNDYADCDQIVLIGVANPNSEEIHIREQARRVDEDYISDKSQKDYKHFPGSKIKRKSWFYEDERMNAIIKQYREDEMVQAIYRIRPLQSPEKKIWILSGIQLPLPTTPISLNSDELAILLGLQSRKAEDASRAKPAFKKLIRAVRKLRHNHHDRFSSKKLADTAVVNLRTVHKYIDALTDEIPYLERRNDEFFINKND